MIILTVTNKGEVTLSKEIMEHLGVSEGKEIAFKLVDGGAVIIKAACQNRSINNFIGMLAGKTSAVATIEELNRAAEEGWGKLE